MIEQDRDSSQDDEGERDSYTVIGLFETPLDAEEELVALRRAARPPEQISVLVRDMESEARHGGGNGAVARAVVENALEAVGGWLLGLAALIVPDRGTYLVAGPIGAALAGMSHARRLSSPADPVQIEEEAPDAEEPHDDELQILLDFGFSRDEASYIAHRLTAGDSIVAVTTGEPGSLQATRRLFAHGNAVHIGQARTRGSVARAALGLLASPVTAAAEAEVVVTDAAAPLRGLCQEESREPWVEETCGMAVVDRNDEPAGDIDDLLADAILDSDSEDRRQEVRYAIIGFGGVLGLGRRRVAVPADLLSFDTAPARLAVTREFLHRAPLFDPAAPFSRREEEAIFTYFDDSPYWSKAEGVIES
jgi:hypothetical protein